MANLERAVLVQIEEFIISGQYKEANQLLESLEKAEKKLNTKEKLQSKILLSSIQIKQGNFKIGMKTAESIFKRCVKSINFDLSLEAINLIATALNFKGEINEIRPWIEKGEVIFEQLREYEGDEFKAIQANFLMVKGVYLYKTGEFEEARINLHQALFIIENYGEHPLKADILCEIASLYQKQGNIDLAIETFQQSLDIWEAIENPFSIAKIKNKLASILALQGDIHLALGVLQEELEIVMRNTDKFIIADYQFNIGLIYLEMNKIDLCLEWLNLSYKNFKSTGNSRRTIEVLYYLILVYIKKSDIKKLDKSIEQIQLIEEKNNDFIVNQWFWLSQALILSRSNRYTELGKIEEIYTDIIKGNELDQKITVIAMLNLCELQLNYLHKTGDQELQKELELNLERLLAIADLQDSYILFIKTYIIQVQLAVLSEDIKKAEELLKQAQSLAQIKELFRLADEVTNLSEVLKTKLELWEKLYQFNASLIDLMELTPFENGLKNIARESIAKKILLQIEDPILIFIQDPGGTSMYSKKFLPDSEFDEQLVSAFLFAINNFMQETFAGKGFIERINYLDYTVIFKPKDPFLICYAYRGLSYTAQQNLDRFAERLDNNLSVWQSLVNYTETGFVPELEDLLFLENLIDDIFNPENNKIEDEIEEELIRDHLSELLSSKL